MNKMTLHCRFSAPGKLILFLSLVFWINVAYSQHPAWDNYLYTNDVVAVCQQDTTFWIATRSGGLIKTSTNFSSVQYYNKHNSGIPTVFLSSMALDSSGNMWIGTHDGNTGLLFYDGDQIWKYFNTLNSPIPSNNILSVAIHDGVIWIGTDIALVKFDGINWTLYDTASYSGNVYPIHRVKDIGFDTTGNVWCCSYGEGVMKYDGLNWTVYTSTPCGSIQEANSLCFDSDGNLWAGVDIGVVSLVGTSWTSYGFWAAPCAELGPLESVQYVRPDTTGRVWAISRFKVWRFTPSVTYHWQVLGWSITPVFTIPTNWSSFYRFNNVCVDNTGTGWVGGYYGLVKRDSVWKDCTGFIQSDLTLPGIQCLVPGDSPQSNFFSATFNYYELSLWSNYVILGSGVTHINGNNWTLQDVLDSCYKTNLAYSLLRHNGHVWAGIRNGIVQYGGGNLISYNWNLPCSTDVLTTAIAVNDNGMYAGTSKGHLLKFNGNAWDDISSSIGISGSAINAIHGRGDTLLIGSEQGLISYDAVIPAYYNTVNTGLLNDTINDILWDNYNQCYWLATKTGIVKTDLQNWTVFHTGNSQIPENHITCLALDLEYNLWIGTKNSGIAMFNGSFAPFDIQISGLSDNRITDILVDGEEIWIGTEQGGISVFHSGIWLSDNNLAGNISNAPGLPKLNISPNPVINDVRIDITPASHGKASVVIYSAMGKKVKTLYEGNTSSEHFSIPWDSKDDQGNTVNPGVYFCTLTTETKKLSKKIILITPLL